MVGPVRTEANIRRLKGNEVLVLDEPSALWIIERGGVAVFGAALHHGVPAGRRRFFFSSGAGEALFGLPAAEQDGRPAVIAVALAETTLRRVSLTPAGALTGGVERAAAELSRPWVERWNASVGPVAQPAEPALGSPEAHGAGTMALLAEFHGALLLRLRELDQQERQSERARLLDRELRSQEAARQAVAELTAVLEPDRGDEALGSDLFAAAQAVARAVGMDLRRPAAWEETALADPVEVIARASRVRVRQVVLHDSWWRQDCGPLLGFLGPERTPVALLPVSPRRYQLLDPATSLRRRVDAGLAAALEPQAYAFYRPLPARSIGGLDLLRFALAGRGRDLVLIFATACAATLLGMLTPQAMAVLVDQAIPGADRSLLRQIGLGLLAAALGVTVFRLAQGIAMMRLETAADARTQSAVWDRLLGLQLSFFRRFSTGDLQSRVTAISQIRSHLGGATLRSLFSSLVLLLNLGLLLYYSPLLTLVAVGAALVSGAIAVVSGLMILRRMRLILELQGRFFGLMVQLISGVAKLRVAAAEERAFGRWAREYARLLRLELRQRRIQDAVEVINIAVSTVSAIILFALVEALIRRAAGGPTLTAGVFLAFYATYGTFIGAIVSLSTTITDVMAIAILRERARPILEAAPEVNERKTDPGRLAGRIELQQLTFRYEGDGPIVLDEVSLCVEPGQFIALVGPSGSGKSTLFRLLLGFETPESGTISYDGQDLGGLDVQALRRQMGVVLQNGRINAGSIHENIACNTQVSLNDAWQAARDAGFEQDIAAMPMGLHTVISEGGTNLSGGQRQRLLLARALVHKPAILLLDEATSSLDNTTQAIVSESLRQLRISRLVIAHRLSTIRRADRIYVIDSGRVVEAGTFDELGRQSGLFSRLMARQLT